MVVIRGDDDKEVESDDKNPIGKERVVVVVVVVGVVVVVVVVVDWNICFVTKQCGRSCGDVDRMKRFTNECDDDGDFVATTIQSIVKSNKKKKKKNDNNNDNSIRLIVRGIMHRSMSLKSYTIHVGW
jgi:hypothetical protein